MQPKGTLTFHRLLWSILNVCLPRKTKTIQKKAIWSFLRHLTLIFYLSKVTKTIFPQVIFDVKFPALFKSAVKNRGSHLRKGSYLHLTLKSELKVKINVTVKCPPRSWSTFVRTIFIFSIFRVRIKRHGFTHKVWNLGIFWPVLFGRCIFRLIFNKSFNRNQIINVTENNWLIYFVGSVSNIKRIIWRWTYSRCLWNFYFTRILIEWYL